MNAGFNKYLIDGFMRGIPPTDATLMKKNTILNKVKQKPMEYMSFLLKWIAFFTGILFGMMVDAIKNAINPNSNVITRLVEGGFIDKSRNNANINKTINGWKRYSFRIMFLFKKLKKFSLGYKLTKTLLVQCFSRKPKIEKIIVNKKDL